jgi:hypothetical protein
MHEILPGIFHWTAVHPKIRMEVSSYYLWREQVLIDPLVPAEGLEWFAKQPPRQIYLTIRHHYRHCAEFAKRFGCDVWCVEQGLHEFTHGENVRAFRFGDMLPGEIEAIEIGALCPDEGALYIARDGGCVALGDGCIRQHDGPLQFVPDRFMGDDPDAVKSGLRKAYRRLVRRRKFDTLLLSHGDPWVGGGKAALRRLVR